MLRHEDLHGHSGLGCVAGGIIFDNGLVSMTWLSEWASVTMFKDIRDVKRLHGHEGRTEIIVEGVKKDAKKFEHCQDEIRAKKSKAKNDSK